MTLMEGMRLGPYEVKGQLGAGGMGQVYLALDGKLGRQVALKVLREEYAKDAERLRRFEREARSASALNHPNIVTIYDISRSEGAPYIVMELVRGKTLRERMSAGRLSVAEILPVVLQIADGLAEAHLAGIVHRDLKPENVMLTGDGYLVKILDFGLAKLLDTAIFESDLKTLERGGNSAGLIVGTVGYMSPEQASGGDVDPRADQFALGTILYEMLTGRRAFARSTPIQTLAAIIEQEPEPIDEPSWGLGAIVARLLSKNPGLRYPSTAEVVDALHRIRGLVAGKAPFFLSTPGGTRPCLGCGHPNPMAFRYCSSCGAPVESASEELATKESTRWLPSPSDPLPGGERRHATVVAFSLGGYAELVERSAPLEVERILGQLHRVAAEVVEAQGGVLNEVGEEDMVALFGLPATHEDDVLRAARAARELSSKLRELEHPLRLQTGISSGTLIVQRGDSEGRRYKIAGEAMSVAARLVGQIDPGDVLVSAETHRLLSPYFESEAGESIRVKGRKEPVATYRLLEEKAVRTRLEASAHSGLTTYAGREREMAALEACLERVLAGEGQVVTIVGDAGIGKSRLLHELGERSDRSRVAVLSVHCQSSGSRTPFLPWIEVLRQVLDLSEEARPEDVVASTLAIDSDLEIYLPLYLHLLSLSSRDHVVPRHLQGEDLRLAIFEALSALFTSRSRSRPLLFLLEDWHWADEASLAALRHLAGLSSGFPVMLLVTYRPELTLDWGNHLQITSLPLGPLGASSSLELVRAVFAADELPRGLDERIYEKTGGNPFFIEELCRAFVESGAVRVSERRAELDRSLDKLHIPESVQTVIRSRLDRLDSREQDVLRRAAVVGREFGRDLLQRIVSEPSELAAILERLKRAGLIAQVRLLPEAVYRFHHVLTLEVAYDSLLTLQRQQLHQAVGAAIEDLYAGRDDKLNLLAHHFSESENWEKAVRYGKASAKRAMGLTQFPDALAMVERTLAWLSHLPDSAWRRDTQCELYLQQERLCETLGERERQQAIIDELLSLLPADDLANRAAVLCRQGELETLLGDETAERTLQRALELSRELNDPSQVRYALRSLGFLYWNQRRYQEARRLNEEALAIARRLGDPDAIAGELHSLGQVLRSLGAYNEARDCLEECHELSERHGNVIRCTYCVLSLGHIYRDLGDIERATECFERVAELCTKHRLPIHKTFALINLGGIHHDRGDGERAIRSFEEALWLSESCNYAEGRVTALRNLGDCLFKLGRFREALPYLREAVELFGKMKDVESQCQLLATVAALHAAEGEHEKAHAAWKEQRALRRTAEDAEGELAAVEGMASSARQASADPETAIGQYREAVEIASRLGQRTREAALLNTLGILEWGRGRYMEALTQYERALGVFRELHDDVHAGLMLNSIAATLKKLERHAEARLRFNEALLLHARSGERMLEAHARAGLAEIEQIDGDAGEALAQLERSLSLRRELGDERGEGWMCYELSRLLRKEGRSGEGEPYLVRAKELASRVGDSALAEACSRSSTA